MRAELPKQYLIDEHGEIITEFKQKALKIEHEGTTIYTALKRYQFNEDQKGTTFIMLFSAKLAGIDYFSGITKDTIKLAFEIVKNKLNSDCDFDDFFFYARIADLDICKDEPFYDRDEIEKYLKNLKELVKQEPSLNIGQGIKLYNGKKTQMLQVNRRENSSLKKPFLKFYNKKLEMERQHPEFMAKFLDYKKLTDNPIMRTEFTIRDTKMFRAFGMSDRLKEIMRYTDDDWMVVYADFYCKVFRELENKEKDNEELSGKDLLIFQLLKKIHTNYKSSYHKDTADMHYISFLLKLPKEQPNRMAAHRTKKLIDLLTSKIIEK